MSVILKYTTIKLEKASKIPSSPFTKNNSTRKKILITYTKHHTLFQCIIRLRYFSLLVLIKYFLKYHVILIPPTNKATLAYMDSDSTDIHDRRGLSHGVPLP